MRSIYILNIDKKNYKKRLKILLKYAFSQGLLQIFSLLNGFFLLRWLSIEEQAKFSLAMGIQATVGLLGDLGFGGSLLGLIGDRTDDKEIIGKYIAALNKIKQTLLIIGTTLGGAGVYFYTEIYEWTLDFWLMYLLIVVSIQAQSTAGYYSALLQMKQDLFHYYSPQILSSALRLVISMVLFKLWNLTALEVMTLTTMTLILNMSWIKQKAKSYYKADEKAERSFTIEIIKKLWPVIPIVIFYAFQGQITLFIAGMYGKSKNLAEMGALTKIGQLFSLLTPFNTLILLPYLARANTTEIKSRLPKILMFSVALTIPIISISYFNPGPLLWMLGEKYKDLESLIGPYVLGASIWYISSVIWAVNTAKNWNHWIASTLYICTLILIQALSARAFDLSKTSNLITMNILMAAGTLTAYIGTMITGLKNQEIKA